VLSVLFFATNKDYGDHILQVFMTINFLLLFTKVSAVWSLDAVLYKLRTGKSNHAPKVSVLNYYSFVLMAIGLVYFVSLFDKYLTDVWRNGMVFYSVRSLPEYGTFNIQCLLDQKLIMMGFAYFALAFETIFIFVCFNKIWRPYICVAGMALHFGIFLFFPFKIFALGFMALYLLMVPFSFWKVLGSAFRPKSSTTLFLNSHHPMSASVDVLIRAFDVFRCYDVQLLNQVDYSSNSTSLFLGFAPQKGITSVCRLTAYVTLRLPVFTLLGLLLYIPFINTVLLKWYKVLFVYSITTVKNTTLNPIIPKTNLLLKRVNINMLVMACLLFVVLQANAVLKTKFAKTVGLPEKNIRLYKLSSTLFGITNHNIFTKGFENIDLFTIGITKTDSTRTEIWLPLTAKDGEIGTYKKGSLMKKSYFASKNLYKDSLRLYKYAKDFTAFWSFENNVDLDNADFKVYVKKYVVPKQWEKNVYQKNLDKSWIPLGKVIWRDTLFYPQLDLGKVP
jgi:hypothetical protein